jgi:hypothetical protein
MLAAAAVAAGAALAALGLEREIPAAVRLTPRPRAPVAEARSAAAPAAAETP